MKEPQQNGTQESLITYIRTKYRQKVCRRIFEILTGIKMLNVNSFCSVVILTSSGSSLDPDHTLRFTPLCGLQISTS